MPLIHGKSNKSLQKNIKTEMDANPGKAKRAQNLAIAYSVQRQAKKKKMAQGGEVTAKDEKRPGTEDSYHDHLMQSQNSGRKPLSHDDWLDMKSSMEASNSPKAALNESDEDFVSEHEATADNSMDREEMDMKGRSTDPKHINEDHDEDIKDARLMAKGGMIDDEDERPRTIAEAIMRKRAKKMADGGMVDIQENGEEEGSSPYDDDNHEAVMKELYDDSQLDDQPKDSNEHGHDLSDEDAHDMVEMIRRKLRSQRS